MKSLGILGSTGSIGTQILQVIDGLSDQFDVRYLTAQKNIHRLAEQALKYLPDTVCIVNENYKNAYYSQKELGGGITLTMIHELNLARKLLGDVKRVSSFLPISTNLEVDVDINSNIMLYHNNGAVSQIHLDCIQKVMNRSGKIYFERGWISYDFISSELKIKNEKDVKEKMIWNDLNFDPNEMYKKELLTFIDLVDNKGFKHEYDFYNAKLDLGIVEDVFKY